MAMPDGVDLLDLLSFADDTQLDIQTVRHEALLNTRELLQVLFRWA
jgi:hypothetical protein